MYRQSVCSFIVVSVLALAATQTQGSPYDRVAYWDSTYATSWAGDGIAVRDALAAEGYTVVNAAELKTWMDARIADKKLSVVVFCRDDVPTTVTETETTSCTLRQYLDAGGKIVWYADIPFYYQANATGGTTNWGTGGSTAILGFNAAGGTWDVNGQVTITEAGTRWGLTTSWSSSRPAAAAATDNFEILATDTNGAACGWVKHYVAGDTFRGFVRIDDHSGAPANIAQLIAVAEYYEAFTIAIAPVPDSAATDVPRDVVLSWTPGESAATHDVYFGTSFEDVNSASTSDPRGVLISQGQVDAAFDPEGLLEYGQTYYWRIDEVNGAPDYTLFKGEVWSFTTETYAYPITGLTVTASSAQPASPASNTINGSGLNDLDQHGVDLKTMWVTPGGLPAWIQYTFDREYKLHELWVWNANSELEAFMGFGAKGVTIEYSSDGATWTALENVPEFVKGTGSATYTANNIIDLGEVMAKYVKLTINTTWGATGIASLSEVRFFYTPVQGFEPDPTDGETGIALDATLNWRPGREAVSHKV
ncbi:MAG: discoidin domain-containing protein [Phycisphaerales bacterium]